MVSTLEDGLISNAVYFAHMKWILSDVDEIHFSFVHFERKMKKGSGLINLNVIECKVGKKMVHNRFKRVLIWRN